MADPAGTPQEERPPTFTPMPLRQARAPAPNHQEKDVELETLKVTKKNSVATVCMNRPESYNALNDRMAEDLLAAMLDVQNDSAVRAVVLTGAPPAFCAGGDVKAFVSKGDDVSGFIDRMVIPFHAFISHMVRMPKPIIGAVNGTAAGGGLSIAMACDMVVMHEDAVLSTAYSRIGASPDGSLTYFLVRLLGMRRAMELYLTNRVLTAAEALDWGLATRVLPESEFATGVESLAMELAAGPTQAYGRAKDLFYHSLNNQLETQMELEARNIVASSRSYDFKEGTKAFVEKRAAKYEGR